MKLGEKQKKNPRTHTHTIVFRVNVKISEHHEKLCSTDVKIYAREKHSARLCGQKGDKRNAPVSCTTYNKNGQSGKKHTSNVMIMIWPLLVCANNSHTISASVLHAVHIQFAMQCEAATKCKRNWPQHGYSNYTLKCKVYTRLMCCASSYERFQVTNLSCYVLARYIFCAI